MNRMPTSGRAAAPLALVLYLFLFVASPLRAADLAPLLPAPGPLSAPAPAPDIAAAQPAGDEAPDPDAVIVDGVTHITFAYFSAPPPGLNEAARPSGRPNVTNSVPALDADLARSGSDLDLALRQAFAGELTWRKLDALTAAAAEAAHAYGWSLAQAFVPEQELTGGALRIEIIPVWMDDVAVQGAKWSNAERLRRPYLPFTGRIIRLKDMTRLQSFHNSHSFRQVVPALTPGKAEGSSTYVLNVREKKPWRVYSNYDTTHSRTSGSGRLTGGVSMVAPWRTDDTLTMQYTTDNKFDHSDSFSLVYRHALPWRHFFTVTGLWSKSDTVADNYFGQESKDLMLRLAYSVPLPEAAGWEHSLEAGWEWRRSRSVSDFSGTRLSRNTIVSAPFSLGWQGGRPDRWGSTSLSLMASAGPGGYMGHMRRDAYDRNREGADRAWLAVNLEAHRNWVLPGDFLIQQRSWLQWSSNRLADANQFYLGGNNNVRGYRESEISGDKGLGVSIEARSPSLLRPLAGRADAAGVAVPELRLAGFWDWGVIKRNGPLQNYERKSTVINGAGVGLRFLWGEWVSAQIDYAWRIRDTGRPEDDRKNGFLHASVSIGF